MSQAPKPTIDQIIQRWRLSWGDNFPKQRSEKLTEFSALFETCKEYGYSLEDFLPSIMLKILNSTINENYKNKNNLKTWRKINQDLMEQAQISTFDIVKLKEGKEIEEKKYENNLPEYTDEIVIRPDLDRSKLGKIAEKATVTVSDEDFLNELENSDD